MYESNVEMYMLTLEKIDGLVIMAYQTHNWSSTALLTASVKGYV